MLSNDKISLNVQCQYHKPFFPLSLTLPCRKHTKCFSSKLIFKFSIYITHWYTYMQAIFSRKSIFCLYTWSHPFLFQLQSSQHLHLLENLSSPRTKSQCVGDQMEFITNYKQWISFGKVHDLIFVYVECVSVVQLNKMVRNWCIENYKILSNIIYK